MNKKRKKIIHLFLFNFYRDPINSRRTRKLKKRRKRMSGKEGRKKVNPKTQLGLVARVFAENTRVEDRLVDEK